MKVILVRHGQTQWNKEDIFRGTIDVDLDETGIRQAELASKALARIKIDAVYSSPMKRAITTATIIARPHGLPVQTERGFGDFSFGEWQGKSRDEIRQQYPDLYSQWETEPHKVRFPGGDSLDDLRDRALPALERVIDAHSPDGTVVVVSHRVVTKVLLCAILGLDNSRFWHIRQDVCCFNIFERDSRGRYIIHVINDTCHLREIAAPGERLKADF
ncbi:MAG TPA: histidine phosphatase family protein [Firmicutes bacterium]|nr:histidine phosphatase family protein [Bacillota bacterium]